jgi:hypothetical protein
VVHGSTYRVAFYLDLALRTAAALFADAAQPHHLASSSAHSTAADMTMFRRLTLFGQRRS